VSRQHAAPCGLVLLPFSIPASARRSHLDIAQGGRNNRPHTYRAHYTPAALPQWLTSGCAGRMAGRRRGGEGRQGRGSHCCSSLHTSHGWYLSPPHTSLPLAIQEEEEASIIIVVG